MRMLELEKESYAKPETPSLIHQFNAKWCNVNAYALLSNEASWRNCCLYRREYWCVLQFRNDILAFYSYGIQPPRNHIQEEGETKHYIPERALSFWDEALLYWWEKLSGSCERPSDYFFRSFHKRLVISCLWHVCLKSYRIVIYEMRYLIFRTYSIWYFSSVHRSVFNSTFALTIICTFHCWHYTLWHILWKFRNSLFCLSDCLMKV